MLKLILIFILSCTLQAIAFEGDEVGEVQRITGDQVFLARNGVQSDLKTGDSLVVGDKISTGKGVAQLLINPTTQINVAQNSQIEISEQMIEERDNGTHVTSVIKLLQGHLRLLVEKLGTTVDQRVEASGAAFAVRGTEFELLDTDDGVDLQVFEGEVEVLENDSGSLGRISKEGSVRLPKIRNGERRALITRQFQKRERLLAFAQSKDIKNKWQNRLQKREQNKMMRKDKREERMKDLRQNNNQNRSNRLRGQKGPQAERVNQRREARRARRR